MASAKPSCPTRVPGELSGDSGSVPNVSGNRQTGFVGEQAAGIDQVAKWIESLNGTGKYKIPDAFTRDFLAEVKTVARLSDSPQLSGFTVWTMTHEKTFNPIVRSSTVLSKTIQELVNGGVVSLWRTLP